MPLVAIGRCHEVEYSDQMKYLRSLMKYLRSLMEYFRSLMKHRRSYTFYNSKYLFYIGLCQNKVQNIKIIATQIWPDIENSENCR